jgi:hypothetical protein
MGYSPRAAKEFCAEAEAADLARITTNTTIVSVIGWNGRLNRIATQTVIHWIDGREFNVRKRVLSM